MSVRTPLMFLTALFLSGGALASAADIAGIVVDQSGRAVPRAYIRVIDASGGELAAGFADEAGRFILQSNAVQCQVEATLTGFRPATVGCQSGEALRIVLSVAPVEERVIVSATRTEAPSSQVGASATIFTAEDLERDQKPLIADLLMATPGAMLVRNGGPGTVTSLFVRGGESDYNKILLDGVPLNEPGGTYFLSNLTTENLERVEVVRGAYSSLFGSDAMASVIQLVSKRAGGTARRPAVTAQIDGGTYNTLHASGNVTGAAGKVDYNVGGARFNSDNRVPNSRFENTTWGGSVGVALSASATLRVMARGERGHVGTPGQTAFGRPDLDAFAKRHDDVVSVSFEQEIGRVRQRATYARTASRQQSTNLIADPPFRAIFQGRTATRNSSDFTNDSLTKLKRYHAGYQADIRVSSGGRGGDQRLTLFADWDGERSDVRSTFGDPAINTRDNFGVAAQQQVLWPRVYLTIGGRIERNDNFGVAAVPRATVVYVIHRPDATLGETQLKASAGAGIKEPTMLESFSPSPFFRGNPDLRPERSRSAEVGLSQRFAHDRAKVEFTYFHNRFQDVITLISNPATSESQYENVGLTRARGIELGFQMRPVPAVQVHGAYTLLDTKVLASERPNDILFGLGKPLSRRPKHSGTTGVTLNWDRVSAGLNGVFVGAFADSDFGLFNPAFTENPGHTTWDARFSVKVLPQLTAILAIDNLTNEDYSEPFGYQPLLRVVRGGFRVGF